MTHPLDEILREHAAALRSAGIEGPVLEIELIVAHVLGVSRGRVQTLSILGEPVDTDAAERIAALAAERARRVPLQHLTGTAPFRGLELSVGPGVFIPRPETETVVQHAIDALRAVPDPRPVAIDLCTGSGAIALAIAQEVPTARVWAVEKSRSAHAWAERNVARYGDGRVRLILGDVEDLDRGAATAPASEIDSALVGAVGAAHVVISNPPYVPSGAVPRDPEVRDHDPALALYSGEDGLDLIRVMSRAAARLLRPGGLLVLEHAEHQGTAIRTLLTRDGWRAAATHPDLTARDRATTAILPEETPVGEE